MDPPVDSTAHPRWVCRWVGYAAVVLAAALAWVVVLPAVAEAHTVSGQGASNYRTTVAGLRPSGAAGSGGGASVEIGRIAAAVELTAVENGSRLRLAVHADHTVLVGGYEHDVYLRLDRTGVWENTRSSAVYLNGSRYGTTRAPSSIVVDPGAAPTWERIGEPEDGQVVALWHDHRAHWMSDTEPPVVRASPGTAHRISGWAVPLTVDGTRVEAYGTLDWVPGPSPLPWVALAFGLGVGVAACGLARRRWGVLLAVAAAAAVAADVTHAALAAAADAGDPLGAFVWGNTVVALVWVGGLAAAVLLLRRSVTGLYLAAACGFVLALVGGFADVGVLYRSGAPVAGPLGLTRAAVAASVGLGLGLVAAVALAGRRQRRDLGGASPAGAADAVRPHPATPATAPPGHAGTGGRDEPAAIAVGESEHAASTPHTPDGPAP
jgi:hypothetical protein